MVIIIGAGLSGLLTAYRLQTQGIPYTLLDARSRIGGRINTLYKNQEAPIEMGATWFGDYHKNVKTLLQELNLTHFKQHMDDTVFYEPTASSPARQVELPPQTASYRISGGTSTLINTIYNKLDASRILLNQEVHTIKNLDNKIQVSASNIFEADTVVIAIPPKLWSRKITFDPQLPDDLTQLSQQTHTWMEDSIKLAITYATPFWKSEHKPSTLFSNVGPITEFYDQSNHEQSKYALCGFINSSYNKITEKERQELILKQLVGVFGEKAREFTSYNECLWSNQQHTFIASETSLFPHQNNGNPMFRETLWVDKLFISSSESAAEFPGYMDGAIASGNTTAIKIINLNGSK